MTRKNTGDISKDHGLDINEYAPTKNLGLVELSDVLNSLRDTLVHTDYSEVMNNYQEKYGLEGPDPIVEDLLASMIKRRLILANVESVEEIDHDSKFTSDQLKEINKLKISLRWRNRV